MEEDCQGILGISRSYDDLEEYLVDFLGGLGVDFAVADDYAAEGADGVGLESRRPGFQDSAAAGQTAGVVVLQDSHGAAVELVDEIDGGVDVQEVVVGNLLAVELLELAVEIAVEAGLLVGILAVAEGLGAVDGDAQSRELAGLEGGVAGEPGADVAVVAAADGKGAESQEQALLGGRGGAVAVQKALR